jgi:hypothetical protein
MSTASDSPRAIVPDGKLGGESSFSGKANGLWLWQNDIGLMIVDQIARRSGRAGRHERSQSLGHHGDV